MFSPALALSSLNASFNNIGAIIVVIITTINIGAKITFDIIPNFTPLFATIRATKRTCLGELPERLRGD